MPKSTTRENLHQVIDQLPDDTIQELAQFIDFLQFKNQAKKSDWPPDFLNRVIGGWTGEALERPPQGVFEERDLLL